MTEGAEEKSPKLTRRPQEKATFTERDFKASTIGLLYGALLYIGCVISGKVAPGRFFWVKFCNLIFNSTSGVPSVESPVVNSF